MSDRTGTLATEPLPALIHAIYKDRLTGILTLNAAGGRSEIYFRAGYPVGVTTPGAIDHLGRVVVESNMLDETTLLRAAAGVVPDGPGFGTALVAQGLLTDAQLVDALKIQVRRRLHRLFFLERGDFSIRAAEHDVGVSGDTVTRIHPRRAVYQGIRTAWPATRVRAALARFAGRTFRVVADSDTIGRYTLSEDDAAVVDTLGLAGKPLTPEEAAAAAAQPLEAVQSVFVALLYTEALVVAEAGVTARAPEKPAPAPAEAKPSSFEPKTNPSSPGLDVRGLRDTIAQKLRAVDGGNLFDILGVPQTATKEAIKTAYLGAAKVFHPDRFSSGELEALRPDVERLFRHLNEAYATLYDDHRRAAYLDKLAAPAGEKDDNTHARAILDAEMAFLQGDVHLKKRNYTEAVAAFARALELNPQEGEHIALYAWARVSAGLIPLADIKGDLQKAIAKSPRCARAHCFLGMLYKEEGDLDKAFASLKKASEIDRNLALAASELRLVITRREKLNNSKGLFDRLRRR